MLPFSSLFVTSYQFWLPHSHTSTGQNSESIPRIFSSLIPMFLVNSRPSSCRVPSIRFLILFPFYSPCRTVFLFFLIDPFGIYLLSSFLFFPPFPFLQLLISPFYLLFPLWLCPHIFPSMLPHLEYLPLPSPSLGNPSFRSVIPFPYILSFLSPLTWL